MKDFVIVLFILGIITASVGLLFLDQSLLTSEGTSIQDVLFPHTINYKTAPNSHVDIQRSCADYFVSTFQNITGDQLQQSKLLRQVVSGKTGDGLPVDASDTRKMLAILGKTPDKSGRGEFGINHEKQSYYLKYEFVNEQKPHTDHVIGCYRDGLVSHFENEPIVQEFERQYGKGIHRFASDESVSLSKRVDDLYSARLRMTFDDNFDIDKMTLYCNIYDKEIFLEFTDPQKITNHVENYHCYEDKFPYVKISINEFRSSYAVGDTIDDFAIKLEGYYPTYNSPSIILQDEQENIIWDNEELIGHVYFSRTSPVDVCKEYRFYDIGEPLILNKTGKYKFVFSFEDFSSEHVFYVRENISGNIVDRAGFGCS